MKKISTPRLPPSLGAFRFSVPVPPAEPDNEDLHPGEPLGERPHPNRGRAGTIEPERAAVVRQGLG
ncbi:MAG: hypothetical protein M3495_01715, partial [Pseudomonadota bacterium]|nr:hypothetical protein [Pseudomonadota bacterium]